VRVDVAEPPEVKVSDELLREALRPEAVPETDRVTVPLKPFKLATEIVDEAVEDRESVREEGLSETEKSGATFTATRTVVECECEPLDPVTVTV